MTSLTSRIAKLGFGAAALALLLAPLPAAAEAFTTQPLEGGGEMFLNLPGVNLDAGRNDSAQSGCTQREVTTFDRYDSGVFPERGTLNECNFGNFSIRTINGNTPSNSRMQFPDPRNPFGEYVPPGEQRLR